MVSFPISKQTTSIIATAPILTASRKLEIVLYFLIFGTNGFKIPTKIKDGKNIPIVATKAPQKPFNCQPKNVAVDNTGPGVNCPNATASISSCLVNKPVPTSSASKKANKT